MIENQRPIDIITMGRVAVDLYAEQIGCRLADATSFRKYLGGCAGNIAMGTAQLGLKSAIFSKTGTDEMGYFVKETLQAANVDTTCLGSTPKHLTGLVLLGMDPPETFPLIFYRENCADMQLSIEELDPQLLGKSKTFLITGTGFSTTKMANISREAVALAKQQGCQIVLDLDYRPVLWGIGERGDGETRYVNSKDVSNVYQEFLPGCDLIVGTEEEFLIASGQKTIQAAIKTMRELTKSLLVLKQGSKGCTIYEQGAALTVPGFPVEVLNVLGAGDAFISGFLRGWLRGASLRDSGRYGNAAGALVVTRHSCSQAMPTEEELQYFIENSQTEYETTFNRKIQVLHQEVSQSKTSSEPLFILAFDHRQQFEQSCEQTGKPFQIIEQFKQQVYNGFLLAREQAPLNQASMGILVDPIYGQTIIKAAEKEQITLGLPIEMSAKTPLQWIRPDNLYHQLLQQPKHWLVKVLCHYPKSLDNNVKHQQIQRLQELHEVCQHLNRKLILELITDDRLATIETIYHHHIYPNWWKISASNNNKEWLSISKLIEQSDKKSRVIILGGQDIDVNQLRITFEWMQTSNYGNGFAIGRGVFWKCWEDFLREKMDIKAIPQQISEQYLKFIEIWNSSTKVKKEAQQEKAYDSIIY